jgi:hypothetical protein
LRRLPGRPRFFETSAAAMSPRAAFAGHPEDAVLVAVEGHRLAVAPQIRGGGREVAEGRFRAYEEQLHELAGGVIDVDQERAVGAAVLEPVVLATIDLDELAEGLPAKARLVRHGRPVLARSPETAGPHPVAQRLPGNDEAAQLGQFLGGQRGPEVGVQLPNQAQGTLLHLGRRPIVARLSPQL